MDNTSQRINELLKLAALSDKENQSDDDYPVSERYYEEQPEPYDNWDSFAEGMKWTGYLKSLITIHFSYIYRVESKIPY